MMQRVDLPIFYWVNRWPEAWATFFRFLSEATNYSGVKIFLIGLLLTMMFRSRNARLAAIQALVAFPIANEVTDVLKQQLPDPRPFQVLPDVIMRVGGTDSMGTASAHSANMAAVAVAMTLNLRWWGAPWIIIAVLTGISRIYCGAHFPGQVLWGWCVGIAVGFAVHFLWRAIETWRRQRSEPAIAGANHAE